MAVVEAALLFEDFLDLPFGCFLPGATATTAKSVELSASPCRRHRLGSAKEKDVWYLEEGDVRVFFPEHEATVRVERLMCLPT